MTLKQTPLYATHQALNARIVDFGGWAMPLNYGSQIEEHHQVRRHSGMFDVSHMQALDFDGAGSRDFLRYLLANDVNKLSTPGKALYSCMLNSSAGVIDDLIVYWMGGDWFRMVVNAGTATKDIQWMQQQAAAFNVSIKVRTDLSILAVQGPEARQKFWQAYPHTQAATENLVYFSAAVVGDWFIARTGYTGEEGFEIILPASDIAECWQKLQQQGIAPCGLAARDTLRLEAGMNLYGQDMDETTNPLESGLAWTLSRNTERNFIGKTALNDFTATQHLVGLVLLDKGVLRAHQVVTTPHGDGEITSGSFSPSLNVSIALARLPGQTQLGDTVEVQVRDKMLRAKVVKPPFVRHGKSLISE